MPEEAIIRHCAPTLAGIKTGSLFTCPLDNRDALFAALEQLNRQFRKKGLRLLPLRFTQGKALLYLYRPARLRQDLSREISAAVLAARGYDPENCEQCVLQLARKLRCQMEFPHEIGLFLGYPPEDMLGFLEKGPDHCLCTGCWKVYSDVEAARKTFALYKKCTLVYWNRWIQGAGMDRLAVTGR